MGFDVATTTYVGNAVVRRSVDSSDCRRSAVAGNTDLRGLRRQRVVVRVRRGTAAVSINKSLFSGIAARPLDTTEAGCAAASYDASSQCQR